MNKFYEKTCSLYEGCVKIESIYKREAGIQVMVRGEDSGRGVR